jgi:hypothetical protein
MFLGKIIIYFSKLISSIVESYLSCQKQFMENPEFQFDFRFPNKTTRKTFEDTDARLNLVKIENITEFFKKSG